MRVAVVTRFIQRMEELRGTPHHEVWAWLASAAGDEYLASVE